METEIAIVGAGPYGLALGAHLRAASADFRIFGFPMDLWRNHMPEGMLLKSDGFASNLYDPRGEFPLARYCQENSIKYSDDRSPVRLDTFVNYGLAFRDRLVPNLEETLVDSLRRQGDKFELRLGSGETVSARRVVGVQHFRYIPEQLQSLPPEFMSHSYDHHDLSPLVGRRVAVLGGGASAIDLAALLKSKGCDVQIVCRREKLLFADPPRDRSLWQRVRHPRSGLGPGLKSRLCTDAPLLFHFMPKNFRTEVVRRHLGPHAGWPMKQMVIGRMPVLSGQELVAASVVKESLNLTTRNRAGATKTIEVDHVVCGTGYRVDIRRLGYVDKALLERLEHVDHSPVLSTRFESSVKGLFFTGPIAANSFGPLMRFAFGADFACGRIMPSLGRSPSIATNEAQRAAA
jgi:cation diffusion facilitator CzcD-associated flavoprotein CzcO